MKPLDPRLLTHVRAARTYIAVTAATGFAMAGLIVAQVLLIGYAIAPAITDGASLASRAPIVWALLGVVIARAAVTFAHERYAHRAADRVVADLREQVLTHVLSQGPRGTSPASADTLTLLTEGLGDLRPYFVRYIPQLVLAATVTPATVAVVFAYDWVAGLTVVLTIPLIPVFMALVGWMTESYSTSRLDKMRALNAEVIDLLAGLPTLRGFNRELGPIARVRQLAASYTTVTMQTLKVAFLSGAVLEFLATLSVALVAVGVGMRLVSGLVGLLPGLIVIMLAPECFKPLRQVGAHFHASADGLAAADAAFAILATPVSADGAVRAPAPGPIGAAPSVTFESLSVRSRGHLAPAGLSGTCEPGRITALAGPSGAGKTTAVMAALGVLSPTAGAVRVRFPDGTDALVADLAAQTWHAWCSWVPQRPAVVAGPLLAQFDEDGPAPGERLLAAAAVTGFDAVVADLPDGWATPIGHGGYGLSVGQAQRLALTRALVHPTPVMFFDEPSAHLDAAAERAVLDALTALRDRGVTVVVIAHRPTLVELADTVVHVQTERTEQFA